MNTLGERLTYLRKQHNITQRQLMDQLHFENLSKYESNQREPSYTVLCQLADYYNVSLDWLLTGTQPALQETVLSDTEKELLTSFRHLTQENRLKYKG